MFHVAHAVAAPQLGLCNVAIAYGSTSAAPAAARLRCARSPVRDAAMHHLGTIARVLAAAAARQWALLNPAAWEKPL
jgi:hypothetical protein